MKKFLLVLLILAPFGAFAQQSDSLQSRQLEDLVVTATRNERVMGALPMPVLLIPKNQIRTMGSMRLNEVLAEQTGLAVVPQVNGSGNGLQLQGFDPDYTLILVDGEPLIGRFTGSLDLSRISIGNIKQIEVVKGPSSSLYGSDALAGVVNIITDRPTGTQGSFNTRYGTNNTLDLRGDYGWTDSKLGLYIFGNRYSTDGYDLNQGDNAGKTVTPFYSYTGNAKITYKFGSLTDFSISGRYFEQKQQYDDHVLTASSENIRIVGTGTSADWSISPVLIHRFSIKLKVTGRFYATQYTTKTRQYDHAADTLYYTDDFKQTFQRPEVNGEYYFNDRNILTIGAGSIFESVQTGRYGDNSPRHQQTKYAFFQYEWTPVEKLNLIIGGRQDVNSIYGSQFSPKFSTRYELNKRIALKASYGVGFKSPDFRQLYLNFANTAGGGYYVLGTQIVSDRLVEFQSQGLIMQYLYDPARIGSLQAEHSQSVNAGVHADIGPKLKLEVNGFYNSIDNMIQTQAVAVTTAHQTIYSYINLARTYTTGAEINTTYPLTDKFIISGGYQLLFAKDKDVAHQVAEGNVYWRDPNTLVTQRLAPGEYYGLFNRSRHMANLKLFYADRVSGWEGSIRVIYRGPYGIADTNANSILDVHDNFIGGYAMVNLSLAKNLKDGLRFQVGVDNLLNYNDPVNIPNIPGRLIYASIGFSLSQRKSNSNN